MKKIVSFILLMLALTLVLSSCLSSYQKPLNAAKKLEKKDYHVDVIGDYANIVAKEQDLLVDLHKVSYLLYIYPNDESHGTSGYLLYCEKTQDAKELEEGLQKALSEINTATYSFTEAGLVMTYRFNRGVVKRNKKMVFIGCGDIWDAMETKIEIPF